MQQLSVLLVDDHYPSSFYHKMILEDTNFVATVKMVETGEHAMRYLTSLAKSTRNNLPDLILLDINMPGQNGWEFLATCQELKIFEKSSTVIIVLTSCEKSMDQTNAFTHGIVDDVLKKPFSQKHFKGIITKFFPLLTVNAA